jgi:hypothetical protein
MKRSSIWELTAYLSLLWTLLVGATIQFPWSILLIVYGFGMVILSLFKQIKENEKECNVDGVG